MNVSLEGDLIRPLGLVTLYFGYAEFEVDALLDSLVGIGLAVDRPRNASLGQKLATVRDVLSRQKIAEAGESAEVMSVNRVQFCVGRLETTRLSITRATDVEHVQGLRRKYGNDQ